MIFERAYVSGVKADLGKRELTLTFKVPMDSANNVTATQLAYYQAEDAGAVKLDISPWQIAMEMEVKVKSRRVNEDTGEIEDDPPNALEGA